MQSVVVELVVVEIDKGLVEQVLVQVEFVDVG